MKTLVRYYFLGGGILCLLIALLLCLYRLPYMALVPGTIGSISLFIGAVTLRKEKEYLSDITREDYEICDSIWQIRQRKMKKAS